MKKHLKKILAALIISTLCVTTVLGSILLSDASDTKVQAEGNEIPQELLNAYGGNISFGGSLYVWSGDGGFDPKVWTPDGRLTEEESVKYHDGRIDLTPGATSGVVYEFIGKDGKKYYELYSFTAVSGKYCATVMSKEAENTIYGIRKTDGYSGFVPSDYTKSGNTYVSDRELNIEKNSAYYPEISHVNYSDKYVMALQESSLKCDTPGTYTLTYRVSPVSDAQMFWYEKYSVSVEDKAAKNEGMKITAEDNVIHADVLDENGCSSEVYKGFEYNLSAHVKQITVQALRGYDAYADIEVLKDGKSVDKKEIVESVKRTDDTYIINLKKNYEDGYEIRLSNRSVMEELLKRPDNAVEGGWESHMNDGISVDKQPDSSVKTIASSIKNVFSAIAPVSKVEAAVKNIRQTSVSSAVDSLAISHTADEYHNGKKTGRKVFDGVQVKFSKSKLKKEINEMLAKEGLAIAGDSDIPASVYLNCADHGAAGYSTTQLTKKYLKYVTAYLRKDGNDYYVQIAGEFHAKGRQKLQGAKKVAVTEKPAYLKIHKTTDAGGKSGVVKGAVYGVYTKKSCKDDNRLFKLTLDQDGNATTSQKQAKKLSPDTTYYVKEISSPAGTYLNSTVYSVKTTTGGTTAKKAVQLNVTNEPWRIQVRVHKKDSADGKDLSGAQFSVYEWNGSTYAKSKVITSGADGQAETGWLYYTKTNQGKWRITETKAPDGYKADKNATKDYQINKNNTMKSGTPLTWTVGNRADAYGYLSIQKKIKDRKGNDVSKDHKLNASFGVYTDSGCKNEKTVIHTDAKGCGKSSLLPAGIYYIRETSWGAGMEPADRSSVQKVTVVKDKTTHVESDIKGSGVGIQTEWQAGLMAEKYDNATGKKLAGAEFSFYEWSSAKKDYRKIATRTSGDDGSAKIDISENLVRWTEDNQGRFAVMETKAPEGYDIADTAMHYAALTKENKNTLIRFESFGDTPYGYLDIQKIITDYLGNKDMSYDFSSAGLRIRYGLYYDKECTHAVSGCDNIILEKDGHYRTGAIKPGTYYLMEKTLNTSLFSNMEGMSVSVEIYPGLTTYLDGELGISYDKKTWDNSIW